MGEFNSDNHYIFCGQEYPLKKCSSPHGQQKSPQCSSWVQSKNYRMISVHLQGKPFNSTVIHIYAPTSNDEEAEVEWFFKALQDLLELTPK